MTVFYFSWSRNKLKLGYPSHIFLEKKKKKKKTEKGKTNYFCQIYIESSATILADIYSLTLFNLEKETIVIWLLINIYPTFNLTSTLGKRCPYSEIFWYAFSRIQSECGKMRATITPNTDTFYAVHNIQF